MPFKPTEKHIEFYNVVKETLRKCGIKALRADTVQLSSDVLKNIEGFIHGATFGIALYDAFESDSINPNVSLEVGYMLALNKKICILKDKRMEQLNSDILGKLYVSFDSDNMGNELPDVLSDWLEGHDFLSRKD